MNTGINMLVLKSSIFKPDYVELQDEILQKTAIKTDNMIF